MDEIELATVIASATEVGDLTDVCLDFDAWVDTNVSIRPYFPKYSIDDIRAEQV